MSKNNYSRAKAILQSILQGTDPTTGGELPQDSLLNKTEVLRSIVVAVSALEMASARATRRAMLPRSVGQPWTELEDAILSEEFARGGSVGSIAKAHHRTARAITVRLEKLGLLEPVGVQSVLARQRDIPPANDDPGEPK